jgi:CPA2 family monovalent cation:H+ antiporter-2
LLFQDVGGVVADPGAGVRRQQRASLVWALPLTLGKTVVLFVGLLLASRWVLPRLFHEVAASRSAELFVLLALVIVLLTAWLTHLLGLSPALGAFLAGMLLGKATTAIRSRPISGRFATYCSACFSSASAC